MNILEKRIKIRKLHKTALILFIVSLAGALITGTTWWLFPLFLSYFTSAMCNSDVGHINKQITKNRGTSAEEHF